VEHRLGAIRNLVTAFYSNKWKLLFVIGCKFNSAICNETEFSITCQDGQMRQCAKDCGYLVGTSALHLSVE
jgi:hypothetical protein